MESEPDREEALAGREEPGGRDAPVTRAAGAANNEVRTAVRRVDAGNRAIGTRTVLRTESRGIGTETMTATTRWLGESESDPGAGPCFWGSEDSSEKELVLPPYPYLGEDT